MNNIIFSLNVVLPLFFVLILGYLLKRTNITDKHFLDMANNLCFKLFLPSLLFINIYQTKTNLGSNIRLVIFAVTAVIISILLLLAIIPTMVKDNTKRGVLIQGIYRSNFILFGIPLSYNLFGNNGVAIVTSLIAVIVPLFNISAVIILSLFDNKNKTTIKSVIKDVLLNPLIGAAVLSLLLVYFQIKLPTSIEIAISDVAKIATPLALIVLGGNFQFSQLQKNIKYILIGVSGKLIILPAIGLTIGIMMGFRSYQLGALITLFCAPNAVSSYIMAKNANGDHELAGQIVVMTTVCSIFTIFLFILILKTLLLI